MDAFNLSKEDFVRLVGYLKSNYKNVRKNPNDLPEYGVGRVSVIASAYYGQALIVGDEEDREKTRYSLEEQAKVEFVEIL